MEILETQDPEKRRLIETSDRHRRELEREVKAISDRTEKMLTNALVIGGVLALTYLAVSQLTQSKTRKKSRPKSEGDRDHDEYEPQEASVISQIGGKVLSQATLVLLDIAKDKLMEYLESRKQKNENS